MQNAHGFFKGIALKRFFKLYQVFGPDLKRHRRWFAIAYISLFAATLMNLLKPWPLKIIFDYVLFDKAVPRGISFMKDLGGGDKHILLAISCAGIIVIFFLEGLFTFFRKYFLGGAGEKAGNDIRQKVFAHLQKLERRTDRSADYIVRLTSDIESLKLLLTQHIQTLVNYSFTFAGIVVIMSLMEWKLTLLALAVAPPLYFISAYFSAKVAELTRRKRRKESEVASLVQELITSKEVVRAFAREEQEKRRFAGESDESMDVAMRRMRLSKGFGRTVDVIIAVGTALVVYFGARNALAGHITPGDLIVFVSYLRDLYKPVGGISTLMIDLSTSLVCGERVAEVLETKIRVTDAPDAMAAPPFEGEVLFESVTFGYDTGDPVICDVSFKAKPGETVALIGSSGTGKSTIINLLLRFYDPWAGRILIDGHDIRRFCPEISA